MATRTLDSSPSILPLYARAAAPMIPGASLLPFVPGGGGEIPELDLRLAGVVADPADVAAYAKVCGFALRDSLPATYPHVLAFPLHMAVMADGGFPFGAVGLVHVENRIEQHRRIGIGEELAIRVRPTKLQPHPKGRTFSLLTEVTVGGELVWESASTMLRRGKGDGDGEERAPASPPSPPSAPASAEWKLGGDLGRRYAGVSGDRNPIHMHSLTAKPLGFPGAIAHGMWTKARCLAALEQPPARRLRRRRPLPQADPAAGARRVRQRHRGRGDRLRRARRQASRPLTSTAACRRSTDPTPKPKPGGRSDDQHRHREERQRRRARHGLRPAAAQPPRRLRPARPNPPPQAGRARPLPGHQERLPLGDRRRPHLQGRAAAGQTGAPEEGQVERPVRPRPRRRAADVPGGRPRLRRGEGPPRRPRRRRRLRDAGGAAGRSQPSSASTCSASPRSSAASCTSSPR